jgi:hypothetical protein
MFALQVRPLWQRLAPLQQGCPAAPHATHVPAVPLEWPLQARPDPVQVPLKVPQQGCPCPPQEPHCPFPDAPTMHPSEPVHAGTPPSAGGPKPPLPQQGCPSPPHASHVPPLN